MAKKIMYAMDLLEVWEELGEGWGRADGTKNGINKDTRKIRRPINPKDTITDRY